MVRVVRSSNDVEVASHTPYHVSYRHMFDRLTRYCGTRKECPMSAKFRQYKGRPVEEPFVIKLRWLRRR